VHTLDLILTLRDDVVASASPATEGGHESLDHLPGGMLLGAAAARLYADLPRADSYTLFHSGLVRFGDALPLADDGAPGWPVPACWHRRKAGTLPAEGPVPASTVRNFQFGPFDDGAPAAQLRAGHVTQDGSLLAVRKTLRMKTAIEPESGRVAESQLFGYEAISAGQRFIARIDASAAVPDALWGRLAAVFDAGELRLGRSRSAEYGRVQVRRAPEPASAAIAAGDVREGQVTLWCLSDLALVDEYGQPTLEPRPEGFGLGPGRVDWGRSFLRFRSYAPWNAHRRTRDPERHVLCRGSVIALALDAAPGREPLDALAEGVGLYREGGLGRLWVNPPLLAQPEPEWSQPPARQPAPRDRLEAPRPEHPLVRWLESQRAGRDARREAETSARKLTQELRHGYQQARTYAGLPDSAVVGPSPSQWGAVLARAKEAGDAAALRRALFDGGDAVCKATGEGWQDAFHDAAGVRTFRSWFQDRFLEDLDAMRAFARRAVELARREHGRGTDR